MIGVNYQHESDGEPVATQYAAKDADGDEMSDLSYDATQTGSLDLTDDSSHLYGVSVKFLLPGEDTKRATNGTLWLGHARAAQLFVWSILITSYLAVIVAGVLRFKHSVQLAARYGLQGR